MSKALLSGVTRAKDKFGDTIVSAAFGMTEAACGDGLSEDEAIFLGYLIAEGSLLARSEVRFTNTDPEVAEEYTKIVGGLFGAVVKNYHGVQHVGALKPPSGGDSKKITALTT